MIILKLTGIVVSYDGDGDSGGDLNLFFLRTTVTIQLSIIVVMVVFGKTSIFYDGDVLVVFQVPGDSVVSAK